MDTIFICLGEMLIFFALVNLFFLPFIFEDSKFFEKHMFASFICSIIISALLGYFGTALKDRSKQYKLDEFKTITASLECTIQNANLKFTGGYKVDFLCSNGTHFQKEMSWEEVSAFMKSSNSSQP